MTEPAARRHTPRTPRPPSTGPVSILKHTRASLLVRFQTAPDPLRDILSRQPRRADDSTLPSCFPPQPFYSFFDRETDEMKGKPYGGILSGDAADISRTMPTTDDRKKFEEAKQRADDEWRRRLLEAQPPPPPARKPKKSLEPASQIECIEFGGYEIDTWYAAPYPEEYSRNRILYICEFCLKYMNSDYVAWRHKLKCPAKHPPGDEVYRQGSVSFFEVDGRKNPVYCQNLCLLAKLFLGSKTLYYDVEPFLFYVLCEYDEFGYHFVGYFSKEKRPSSQNNVSCILTLPIHQRKGYGNLLIDFSYLLTRVEGKHGSPEKPLSDMGLVSYRNYWRLVLCQYFLGHDGKGLSIRRISDDTGMTADDVIAALEGLRCLVRDADSELYAFRVDYEYCRAYVATRSRKNYVQLNPKALTWTPYVMGRNNVLNFELGPPLTAMAAREDEFGGYGPAQAGDVVLESTETDGYPWPRPAAPDTQSSSADWETRYAGIPATRFQVFPPVTSRADKARPGAGARAKHAKPFRPKRTGSAVRKTSAQKRKAVVGGTGRGPGRWPKGTKKSDYGNADSGPGLPPTWKDEGEGEGGGGGGEPFSQVQVFVVKPVEGEGA